MLTIQPNLVNSYSKTPAFQSNRDRMDEYVDFEEINGDYDCYAGSRYDEEMPRSYAKTFDFEQEKAEAKKELDLWNDTKQNMESIAKATESVPALKTGTKIISGLISIAVGWGGLRWGSVGTLEVLSKLGKTRLVQALKGYGEAGVDGIKGLYRKGTDSISKTKFYKSTQATIDGWKLSFKNTRVGSTLTNIKNGIVSNPIYQKAVTAKNGTVTYVKNLNPKRIFVETMGVAGGGTTAIKLLGGEPVNGAQQNVEVDNDGNYIVDGRYVRGGYSDVA